MQIIQSVLTVFIIILFIGFATKISIPLKKALSCFSAILLVFHWWLEVSSWQSSLLYLSVLIGLYFSWQEQGRVKKRTKASIGLLSVILSFIASWLFPVFTFADAVSTPGIVDSEYSLAIERGRNIVMPLIRRGSGVSVAVGVNGKIVWSEGFGYQSLETKEPVTTNSQFRIYSLMKQITTGLALRASAQQEINLRAPITSIMTELPKQYDSVSLLHLLTHNAGVRHYKTPQEAIKNLQCHSAFDAIAPFVNAPLINKPGERKSYSSYGFVLANAVIEKSSELSFDSKLSKSILMPFKMNNMALDHSKNANQQVNFYDVDSNGKTIIPLHLITVVK